jgi:hypothetical protein|nr:MAG TPA: Protein of unknown function (DUF1382) [Caudoviricetes sp.]
MKRTPFYRRPGRTGQFSGLRERVIWMIQTLAAELSRRLERMAVEAEKNEDGEA